MARRRRPALSRASSNDSRTPLTAAADHPTSALLWLVPPGLALLCLAIYANAFDAGFALDNRQLILNDPRVHAFTRQNLGLILQHSYWWPYGESGLYRPLTTLSYVFNFAVLGNGDHPSGYHWFNLLLHLANVLMLWQLTRQVTASTWTATVAASMWAASPLSTEAVTNIVGRADLMAATGTLGALLLYLRTRDLSAVFDPPDPPGVPGPPGRRGVPVDTTRSASTSANAPRRARPAWVRTLRVVLSIATGIAVAAGALAKESAVAAVGVLALYEWCWWTPGKSLRRVATAVAICAVPLTIWAAQRSTVLARGGAPEFPFTDNPIVGASFSDARLTALIVMWRYVALLAWPAHLSNDYSFAQIPVASGTAAEWLGVVLLTGGALLALWQLRTHRSVVFFALFALVTFLPASNLLFATGTIMGERLVYLPSAGIAALTALALNRVARATGRRALATTVAVVLVAAYGARTHARNNDWLNDVTLWRSAVVSAPASAKAHRAFAEALYESDPTHANIDLVIAEADKSVSLLEGLQDDRNTFQAFRQAGAYYLDKANQSSSRASASADAEHQRLYLRAQNLLERAIVIARVGSAQLPRGSVEPEADAERLRAVALLGLENPSTALVAANRARALTPHHPLAYRLAASALLALHREDEAAMMLLTGSIISGDASLGRDATTLYSEGLDPDGCAVSGSGASAALNPRCPIVQRHSCTASAAAYQILTKAGEAERAVQIREAAIARLACPADVMDRFNALVP